MQSLIDALVRQGYAVVFGWVLAEQIGLPLPAEPFLLASGGVAGTGRLSLPLILVAASVASLLADAIYIKDTGPSKIVDFISTEVEFRF